MFSRLPDVLLGMTISFLTLNEHFVVAQRLSRRFSRVSKTSLSWYSDFVFPLPSQLGLSLPELLRCLDRTQCKPDTVSYDSEPNFVSYAPKVLENCATLMGRICQSARGLEIALNASETALLSMIQTTHLRELWYSGPWTIHVQKWFEKLAMYNESRLTTVDVNVDWVNAVHPEAGNDPSENQKLLLSNEYSVLSHLPLSVKNLGCKIVHPEQLLHCARHPALTTVDIRVPMSDPQLSALQQCSALTDLTLDWCNHENTDDLLGIIAKLKTLRCLDLTLMGATFSEDGLAMLSTLPLKHFGWEFHNYLDEDHAWGREYLTAVYKMRHLTSFAFVDWRYEGNRDTFRQFIINYPDDLASQLSDFNLVLHGEPYLNDDDMELFAKKFTGLKQIDLYGWSLTKQSLLYLHQHCSYLSGNGIRLSLGRGIDQKDIDEVFRDRMSSNE